MKKFLKKSLALLLALVMVLGLVPGNTFVKEVKAADDGEFYKIVHLDAGRKYFAPNVIKEYIDLMASNGFNQLELYMSDNQGFRFALDDMNVTTEYGTYDLSKSLGNGYDQDYKSSHLNWYRPSLEPDGQNYLTQAEMTDLIQYAGKRGIEIVPCINMPGHMGAILEEFPDFRYKTSQSSLDLENAAANEFALALLEKYVSYFASQGCKYYSIGGDEYAYDIGNDINICNSATYTDYIVPFMNNCAEIIMNYNMTPRAFNDFFGWNEDAMVTKDFQICYWADMANGGGLKHISELISMGYDKFINTNENWYFALGSAYYTLDSTSAGVSTADPYVFCSKNEHPETYENGLGAMFCIWNDRGRLDNATCNTDTDTDGRTTHTNYSSVQEPAGGDGGQTVFNLSKPFIQIMGTKLPKTPIVFHLDQGEDYILGQFEGKQTAEEWADKLGLKDNAVLDVKADHIQEAVANKIDKNPLNAFSNGDLVVVSNGTYYLTLNGEELGSTTDPEKATIWTMDGNLLSANGLDLVGDPKNAGLDELVATTKKGGYGWKVVNADKVLQTTNYGNKYLVLNENGAGASSTPAGVSAYKVVPGVPDLTEVAVVGKAEGTATFTYNGVDYTIAVGNAVIPQCPHENPIHHEKVEPTMDEYGYQEYWECSECRKLFKDADCTQKTTLSALRIDKLPQPEHVHKLTHHTAKPATTTEVGYKKDCWECTGENHGKTRALMEEGCGKFFADAAATQEIDKATLEKDYIIPIVNEVPGEHTVDVAIGGTHTCDQCVVTSVGEDLNLTDGSVKDVNGKEIATYTVKKDTKTDTVGGSGTVGEVITKDTLDKLKMNETIQCALGNGDTFMTADGSVCSKTDADIWTITKVADDTYTIKGTNGYIGDGSSWSPISIGDTAGKWKYDGNQFLNIATYYNGLGLRDGSWQTVYNSAGNNPTPLLPHAVASAGGGEEVTTYTYTFTFKGVAAGSADLKAGDTTFHVKVKDPSVCEHTGGTATCQHGKICEVCGVEYTEKNPDNHEHFIKANCVEKAHCTDCDNDFGEVDPTNHKGPTETRYPNGFDSSNHTGNIYCKACDMLIKQGSSIDPNREVIHMYEDEELEFFVPCGDKALTLNTKDMDESVVVSVDAEHQKFVAGKEKERVTDISGLTNETELVITDGTFYLKAVENEDKTGFVLQTTKEEEEATKFRVYKTGKANAAELPVFELMYKGQYLQPESADEGKNLIMGGNPDIKWVISDGNLQVSYYPNSTVILDEGTPRLSSQNNKTTVGVYTPNTDTPSGMNVKITAGAEGETTFKLGQNTYTIIVEPVVLEGQKVTVDYFITNEWTGYEGETAPDEHSVEITAADPHINTPDGVELQDFVPSDIMHRGFETVYWKGTKHPSDNMQYDRKHTGGDGSLDVTKSKDTVDFKYIRFWGGHWSVSWDGKTWTNLNDGDQLVARYLLQTEVTEEVTTEVQDWGEIAYSNTYRVLLDFAVKYSSGDVRPNPDAYFIDGTSIFYHADPGQDKVEDVNGVSLRRIDTIIGRETTTREVYMITLTPTSDDYTKRLEDTQMGADGKYLYEGTEQIVWLENGETNYPSGMKFHPDFQWGETPTGEMDNELFPDTALPEGYTSWQEIGNTNGEPYVNQVKIYDHQGMLVTYYIRVKEEAKDKLNVHYLEWINGTEDAIEFYKYGIGVKEGTVFDEGFARDDEDETGLTKNKVKNDLDFEQTVDSRLEKMPAVPAKYRTGEYMLYQVERGDDGKDVYLYYAKKSLDRYVVADFGQPLNITWDKVLKGDLSDEYKFVSMSWTPSGTDDSNKEYTDELLFADGLVIDNEGQSCTYTPNKVFTENEKPIHLKVKMIAPVLSEDGTPTGQTEEIEKTYIVHIVPATTVYYEPYNKYVTAENWSTAAENGTAQETYAVINDKHPYGYDPMYDSAAGAQAIGASAGSEITTATIGAKASMTFTGTGFELYANCTKNTGRMMVVLKEGASVKRVISVDTRVGTSANPTVGTDFQTWDNAYNVPVVALKGLDWGTYTVEATYYGMTTDVRKDGVKIDGFRVTRPVNNEIARIVYTQNKEAKPVMLEVRDQVLAKVEVAGWTEDSQYKEQLAKDVLSQVQAAASETPVSGIILEKVDGTDTSVDMSGKIAVDILDNGPKNELYLKSGQTLLMSVDNNYSYQLGVKAMDKQVNFYNEVMGGRNVFGSTDMFYRMDSVTPNEDGTGTIHFINQSTDEAVISLTKLKCLSKNQSIKGDTAEQIFVPFTETSLTAALMSLNLDAAEPELPDEPETPAEPGSNEWAVGSYAVGDVRSYADMLWKCVQAHDSTVFTNIIPGQAPAFWIPFHGMNAEEAAEYVQPTGAHDAYQENEWCIFKGKTYMCKKANTVFDPETYPQGWKKMNTTSNGKGNGKKK